MTRATTYPPADRRSQWYGGGQYGGTTMGDLNIVVLHTTEGGGWPAYSGGSVAPTLTFWPGHGWRQHFALNESGRALENKLGGVQTNTQGVIQVELVGTCDPATATAHPDWTFWPAASDAELQPVADFLRFMRDQWGIPLATSVPWLPYPASYGASPGRMSNARWEAYAGVCAHAHVPENEHGDAGALPILRTLALAAGTAPTLPDPTRTPPTVKDDLMNLITSVSPDGKTRLWPTLLTDNGSIGLDGDEPRLVQRYLAEMNGTGIGQMTTLELSIVNGLMAKIRGNVSPQQIAGAVLAAVNAGTSLDDLADAIKALPAETVAALTAKLAS